MSYHIRSIDMLGGRFGYFLFFLLEGGEGGVRGHWEGGGRLLIENPRRGGGVSWVGEGGGVRGLEGVCGGMGGGLNIFCSGPKCPPSMTHDKLIQLYHRGPKHCRLDFLGY